MIVKGQIKTRPLQQWSVARAFNLRLKRKMDEAGIDIPLPQMQVYTSSNEGGVSRAQHAHASDPRMPHRPDSAESTHRAAPVRDISHEPRPAPPATDGTAAVAPQIPVAAVPGGH
jgi:small conductance mechanosensitive channel